MLKIFQKKQIQKRVSALLKARDTSKLNDKVSTIGFLIDEDFFQDFEKLFDVSKEMGLQSKDVKVFTFMMVKKKLPSLRQNQINNKDFSWKGVIRNQNAIEFLEKQFDVLVGFYNSENDFLDLMVAQSKANFKVGFKEVDSRFFDLILSVNPLNINDFKRELIKYLRVLNKIK